MSHECLASMVAHSRKMIETIGKEVENNFITRKGLFSFSIVGIPSGPGVVTKYPIECPT